MHVFIFATMKLITYFFSILMSIIILINSLIVPITYSYYKLDPIGFIEKLCENIDKPELKCNGKCHLKKIAKTTNDNQKTPESVIDFKELLLYTNSISDYTFSYQNNFKQKLNTEYQNFYSFSSIYDCFHPPKE